ncbi:MAG: CBS domain-containing protein [Albidovulum sp.]
MFVRSVRDVLGERSVPAVAPAATVREAAHVLDHFDIGALVVLDGECLVGVISERDVIRRCVAQDADPAEVTVAQVMTRDPRTIDAEAGLADAIRMMTEAHCRHLPVMTGERCIGLLSIRDIPTEYRMMVERFAEMRGQR